MKPKIENYIRITLSRANKKQMCLIHRLVAIAFIPNPENKPDINHKDGNKKNNCIENLEWVTRSENTQHSFDILHRKSSSWRGGIDIFNKNNNFIIRVEDSRAALAWLRENTGQNCNFINIINRACRGERKTAYGFIFRYAQEKT
jgi:hypothetical protein